MSTTPSLQLQIDQLELAFQKLTGHTFKVSGVVSGREQGWYEFIKAGFTVEDLKEVILWIRQGIHGGVRRQGALKWLSLIGNLQVFEDELQTAKAEKRNAKHHATPKERVIAQARPVALPERATTNDSAKHVSVYIKALRDAVGGPQ